jgi:Mg/Co/Ni transporter MgtE
MLNIEEVSSGPTTVVGVALSRFIWLSGLLLLQSLSSIVLEWHRELIQKHIVVTLFLTMLVRA